jgi:hypothetical protein
VLTSATALGVPGPLGGITFSPVGATLYIGGAANGVAGAVYAAPVVRNPTTQQVTSIGPAVFFHAAPFIDGGLVIDPAGTFLCSRYSGNELGQFNAVTSTAPALPAASASTGGLCFGNAPGPNAGKLFVSFYSNGDIFTVTTTPGPNGTYVPTALTQWAALPFGTEGIAFIPAGPAAGDLLVTNFALGSISLIDVDANTGLPVGGALSPTLVPFATGIGGGEGFAFDPVTNDFFVSTYNGSPTNSLIHISGFPGPNFPLTASAASVSAATGGVVTLTTAGGVGRAGQTFVMFSGATGSVPGVTAGFQHVPLNYDLFSELVLPLVNTPYFQNFVGVLDAAGNATSTFAPPPIPGSAIGVTLTFCNVALLPTFSGASTAVNILITP